MQRRLFAGAVCLLSSFSAVAIEYNSKNHFNLGLNAFYRDYSEDLILPAKSDEKGLLYGGVIGYERKAPNSLMFTFDVNVALGKTKYDGAAQDLSNGDIFAGESVTGNGFSNIDTTLGYTFVARCKHLITPFVGLGISDWSRNIFSTPLAEGGHEMYGWSYFSYGLQYDYDAGSQYQYGLHFKIMPMLEGELDFEEIAIYEMKLGNKTHFEVSAPILYAPDPCNKNYWRFTPYYQYQRFGESEEMLSYVLDLYIYEPASRTHIVGMKVEYSFGF